MSTETETKRKRRSKTDECTHISIDFISCRYLSIYLTTTIPDFNAAASFAGQSWNNRGAWEMPYEAKKRRKSPRRLMLFVLPTKGPSFMPGRVPPPLFQPCFPANFRPFHPWNNAANNSLETREQERENTSWLKLTEAAKLKGTWGRGRGEGLSVTVAMLERWKWLGREGEDQIREQISEIEAIEACKMVGQWESSGIRGGSRFCTRERW